ncbi:hypothetical protein JCM10213_009325 [Rhodosporidiobolus nylandii]
MGDESDLELDYEPCLPDAPALPSFTGTTFPVSTASYTTYRALLCHLYGNTVPFATIRSSKSTYRLCHSLGNYDLQTLACSAWTSQINTVNLLSELLDPAMLPFDEWTDWTVDFAKRDVSAPALKAVQCAVDRRVRMGDAGGKGMRVLLRLYHLCAEEVRSLQALQEQAKTCRVPGMAAA